MSKIATVKWEMSFEFDEKLTEPADIILQLSKDAWDCLREPECIASYFTIHHPDTDKEVGGADALEIEPVVHIVDEKFFK